MRIQQTILDLQIYDLKGQYKLSKKIYIFDALNKIKMQDDKTKLFGSLIVSMRLK